METSWLVDQAGFLAAVILPAVALAGVARRPLPDAGACAACGYDLRGLPASAPCPECGGARRGRRGPLWSPRTWSYAPRRAACCLGLVPIAIGAALAMPVLVAAAWDGAYLLLVGVTPAGPPFACNEMHICFSLAYIGAFAAATLPLARLDPARGFAVAAGFITLGAAVHLAYLAADALGPGPWWNSPINRQRFVFIVFALVVAALAVAAIDPVFRKPAHEPRRAPPITPTPWNP